MTTFDTDPTGPATATLGPARGRPPADPFAGCSEARATAPPSATRLIVGMVEDASTLLCKEIALARAELSEKLDDARAGALELSLGALVLHAGVLFLLLAATAGLATAFPFWIAALIVGVVVTLVGGALLALGRQSLDVEHDKREGAMRPPPEDAREGRMP